MQPDFRKARVLVVGDLMLDRYQIGKVSRISPEAPIPVVKIARLHATLGGAGNVANNIAHLHAKVELIGMLGSDEAGRQVTGMCRENGIRLAALPMPHPTITKTRVVGERQQIVRIDCEEELRWERALVGRAMDAIRKRMAAASVVVISDYGKGFCSPELCALIIAEAKKTGKIVIVDPKGHDWKKYRGATIVTPNVKELSEIAGAPVDNNDSAVARQAKRVRSQFGLGALLVTRSERGMSLIDTTAVFHAPTEAREVFDVSGAGDTVVATLAAALASGFAMREAVALANKAAGIVVAKVGTVPIEADELSAAMDVTANRKLLDKPALLRRISLLRQQGKAIVFTNGCFDILHRGNVHLLHEAKKKGDVLIVALNSDASAARQKGRGAPVNTETDRAHLVGAIDAVDHIVFFGEQTPRDLIKKIRPDVIVKGGNYKKNEVLGGEYAGRVVIIPQLAGYSMREIAGRMAGRG